MSMEDFENEHGPKEKLIEGIAPAGFTDGDSKPSFGAESEEPSVDGDAKSSF